MKLKIITICISLFINVAMTRAVNINIPDYNFQNVSASLNGPVLGTASGQIGTWSAAFTNLVSLSLFTPDQIASSNVVTAGWPAPPDGAANELEMAMPGSIMSSASISEALTNQWQPNSVYTLSVDVDEQQVLGLISGASLSLYAVGSTNMASLNGATLTLPNNSTNFVRISLTYETPNIVPTNAIGISLNMDGVATGGNLYVDNFQLTQNPIQLQVASAVTIGHHGSSSTLTVSGQGGAPGATYEIVTSTNLLIPVSVWVGARTNKFDANGNFSEAFTVDPNTPYRFFRTVIPQ